MPSSPGQWSQVLMPDEEGFLMAPPRFILNRDYQPRHSIVTSSWPGHSDFLEKANRTIAQDHRHMLDPFLMVMPPIRPFGVHSRVSSMESIGSIVEEKSNSPLNKAIATFMDTDGGVASEFVQKLQALNLENSQGKLSIEKFLPTFSALLGSTKQKHNHRHAMSISVAVKTPALKLKGDRLLPWQVLDCPPLPSSRRYLTPYTQRGFTLYLDDSLELRASHDHHDPHRHWNLSGSPTSFIDLSDEEPPHNTSEVISLETPSTVNGRQNRSSSSIPSLASEHVVETVTLMMNASNTPSECPTSAQ
ncbi:hypothetical protein AZE42_08367 [Rhizopogon vesiculosus]|uniref:Uncharacterized protein n=1 Tax=Rhizopogon vesiculosus TaxID=180088 RepID=A0A1J8QGN7_9AGAM|nr:hypothetical protein AZE42_08367 [Rhizopogon vesiculosus]